MMEFFVIYDSTTGDITNGGLINRVWDADNLDGSTLTEHIQRQLAKDPVFAVLYLPDDFFPDNDTHKVENGQVVERTQAEIDTIEQANKEKEQIRVKIDKKMRALAIAGLIKEGELPPDYEDEQ